MKKNIVILGLFLFLTILTTFPLVFNINNHISGFHSTDEPFAALWNFRWLKYSWIKGLAAYEYSTVAAPFGINYIKYSIYPLWWSTNKWLSILTNNVITYNLEVLLSFVLSGLFMYYLANYLLQDKTSAILAGIIYSFCPYHFARAWQHLGLAQIQWMPLYILALFVLVKKVSFKKILSAAICFYLVVSFDFYYAYFMVIVTVAFLIFFFLFSRSDLRYRIHVLNSFIIMGLIILVLTFPIIFAFIKGAQSVTAAGVKSEYGFVRPFNDLFTQSARPLSYFLPASVHPVFGKFTEQLVGTMLYGVSFTEHMLYLGWVSLILAFIAFRLWRRKRRSSEDFYIGFFVLLAIVAWFFSQPPWWKWGPLKIYMPSFFIYKIIPAVRAYCRFGILLMLALAVLAGFGLKFLLEKFKTKGVKVATAALFYGLVLFEFWNYPPFKVIDLSKVPQVYYWLKEQPGDFVIAEYPIDTNGANVMYMFYQTVHEKKIINGTIPGTYANKVAQSIHKLSDPKTAGILKWMGVKYVLVHQEGYLNTELTEDVEELASIPKNPNLRFIKSFPAEGCPKRDIMCVKKTGPIDVYEIKVSSIVPEYKK